MPHASTRTLIAIAVLALGIGCAHADNGQDSFEDGLKNSWSAPAHGVRMEQGEDHGQRVPDFRENHFSEREDHGYGFQVSPVPEPQSDTMLLAGLAVLMVFGRGKFKARAGVKPAAA